MPADVVHRDKRLAQRECERLAEIRADEQRADQAGRAGRRDRIHLVLVHVCVRERLFGHAHGGLHVPPRRDLRYHTAIQRMGLDLRIHHAGKNGPSVLDDGRRRLVAGGLDC